MNCWQILKIAETGDQKIIKKAYARLLPLHHPEKDKEGYQRLRMAFDEALKLAKSLNKAAETPADNLVVSDEEQATVIEVTQQPVKENAHPLQEMYEAYFQEAWNDHALDDIAAKELEQLLQYARAHQQQDGGINAFLIHIDYRLSTGANPDWKTVFDELPIEMQILPDHQLERLTEMLMNRADIPKEFWHLFFEYYPAVSIRANEISTIKNHNPELIERLIEVYRFTEDPLYSIMQTGLSVYQNRQVITHQRHIYFEIRNGNWSGARAYLETLLQNYPNVPVYYRFKLILLDKLRDTVAILEFVNAIPQHILEASWELEKYKADILSRTGQHKEALDIYQRLYQDHMDVSDLYMSIISCSVQLGSHLFYNLELALSFAEQHPAHLGIPNLVRICEEQIIQEFRSSEDLVGYIRQLPTDQHQQLIVMLLKNNLLDEARLVAKHLPDIEGKETYFYQWEVLTAIQQEDLPRVLSEMEKAFRTAKGTVGLNAAFLRCLEYLNEKERLPNIVDLLMPYLHEPVPVEFLLYLLTSLGHGVDETMEHTVKDFWHELAPLYTKMHALFPHNEPLYTAEAKCLVLAGRYEEAIACFQSLADSPLLVSTDYINGEIARIYEIHLNDPGKAEIYYDGISSDRSIELNRAYALHNSGRFNEALEIYLRVVEDYHDKYWIYRDIGAAAYSAERHELALEYLQKALDRDHLKKKAQEVTEMMAASHYQLGHAEQSFAILKTIEDTIEEVFSTALLAQFYRLLEDNERKAAHFYAKIFTARDYDLTRYDRKFVGIQLLAYADMLDDQGAPWHKIVKVGRAGFIILENYAKREKTNFTPKNIYNMVKMAIYLEDPDNARFLFPFLKPYKDQETLDLVMELEEEFPALYRTLYV